jgi:hypothetical protein
MLPFERREPIGDRDHEVAPIAAVLQPHLLAPGQAATARSMSGRRSVGVEVEVDVEVEDRDTVFAGPA